MGKVENKIIVWSIDDFNTLGLMRELGNAELDMLFLVKGHAGFAVKSNIVKNISKLPQLRMAISI